MTAYNTQNYWVLGLFPSSGILENRKHDVSETETRLIRRDITRKYAIKIVIEHAHAWN
jgi:hypothetical protein